MKSYSLKSLIAQLAGMSENLFQRRWLKIVAVVLSFLIAIGQISSYIDPTVPSQKPTIWQLLLTLIACTAVAAEIYRVNNKDVETRGPRRKLTDAEKLLLRDVKASQKNLKAVLKTNKSTLTKLQNDLATWNSSQGRMVVATGGVKVFQRWIQTPQGSGSIVGVVASAEDNTSISKRLTATRMVTLGIFSLAAPKKKGGGFAYVVIEGPSVSGVATFQGTKGQDAGPKAFKLAALINNTARNAVALENQRPDEVARLNAEIAKIRAAPGVQEASVNVDSKIALLPEDLRTRYTQP
jgi:hypothetical protein